MNNNGMIPIGLLSISLVGCASSPDLSFGGTVDTYGDSSIAYHVKYSDEVNKDLKLKSFADAVMEKLSRLGWTSDDDAKFELSVSGDVHAKLNTESDIIYGVTGYSSGTTYGTYSGYGSSGSYSGTTKLNPTYGATYKEYTYETYISNLSINVIDTDKGKSVLSVSVHSEGRTNSRLAQMRDPLAHMLYLNMKKASSGSSDVSFGCFNSEKGMMDAKEQDRYKDKIFENVSFGGSTLHCAEM